MAQSIFDMAKENRQEKEGRHSPQTSRGEAKSAGKDSETKHYPESFVFYRHFCHHPHSPLLQRDAQVKEEV